MTALDVEELRRVAARQTRGEFVDLHDRMQLARAALALAELWPLLEQLESCLDDDDSGPRAVARAVNAVRDTFRRLRDQQGGR